MYIFGKPMMIINELNFDILASFTRFLRIKKKYVTNRLLMIILIQNEIQKKTQYK